MTRKFFITGTDTNIGKTTATIALINHVQQLNLTAVGLKPLATGCFVQNKQLYNEDALLLQQASSLNPEYQDINPFRFESPVSPHIVNHNITVENITTSCINVINKYTPNYCFIEGAGGWLCPLNNQETFADLASNLNIPIILIVGIKLGCLNHSTLTVMAILHKKLPLHGWIANCLDKETKHIQDNIDYLKKNIRAPLLGTINFAANYPENIKLSAS